MKDLLRRVSKAESHRFADCLVVILMSHGEERFIYGSDGEKLHLRNDVYRTFNNEECPALKKKPKIFLVQACRGGWCNFFFLCRDECTSLIFSYRFLNMQLNLKW
ncbi:hypothetical protein HPB48_024312 [Haemaphysalis longicornis]|uniref:Caspase family p20 domain-containing protein n=1 Tax=Haemaphysalis longicornis TaxID=44386 RepID=A0A9J6H7V6_HAELO|nr:hypothetical protein HPB48_024312 [Haemaphysalis longicornis]